MSDEFFQNESVKEVLISRASTSNRVGKSFSLQDEKGEYTKEWFRWNFYACWANVAHCLSDEQRKQWFIDNPEPKKYKE